MTVVNLNMVIEGIPCFMLPLSRNDKMVIIKYYLCIVYMFSDIYNRYIIDDITSDQQYQISLNISICFESKKSCYFTMEVFDKYRLPKIFCDWGTGFHLPGILLCTPAFGFFVWLSLKMYFHFST